MARTCLLSAAGLVSGCAATITCPAVEGESRGAMLLDHGTHSSLVVETGAGEAVRYSWGDRRWYAEGDTGVAAGFRALFLRTDAVLGRRGLRSSMDARSVEAELGLGVENAYVFEVPAARADALLAGLQDVHSRDPEARFRGADPLLVFAPHPRPYTFFYNSNHMVADWIAELGCETRGSPVLSRWRLVED